MYHFFFLGNSHLVYAIIRKRNIFHQVCFYDNFLSLLCVLKLRLIPLYILYLKDLNTKVFIHEYPFTNNSYDVFYPTAQQNHIMSAQKTSNSFFTMPARMISFLFLTLKWITQGYQNSWESMTFCECHFNIIVARKSTCMIYRCIFTLLLTVFAFSWQIFQLILRLFKNQEDDLHHRAQTSKMKLWFFYQQY